MGEPDWFQVMADALPEGLTLHLSDGALLAGNAAARALIAADAHAEASVARLVRDAAETAGAEAQVGGGRVRISLLDHREHGRLALARWEVAADAADAVGAVDEPPPDPLTGRSVLLLDHDRVHAAVATRVVELLGGRCLSVPPDLPGIIDAVLEADIAIIAVSSSGPMTTLAAEARAARGAGPLLLALSSTSGPEAKKRCLDAGFDGIVRRPIDAQGLQAAATAAMKAAAAGVTAGQVEVTPSHGEAAPTVATLIDATVLQDLADQLGDVSIVSDTVGMFLDELDGRTRLLREAAAEEDRDELRRRAHSLKSASAMLGATALAAACLEIEHGASDGQPSLLREQVAAVEPLAADSGAALRAAMAAVAAG